MLIFPGTMLVQTVVDDIDGHVLDHSLLKWAKGFVGMTERAAAHAAIVV